jgi:putative peptidoglycan lipid II flippase
MQGRASSGRNAAVVGAAIGLSRLAGLVRERIFAHYFGNSVAADAFKAALRIPNLLQNLFGEGVLSASFIPVYARLRAEGDDKEAARVASVVAALLGLVVSVLVLAGVLATPLFVDVVAPGFTGDKREATIRLVRILFPGTGLLVLSAWCLGVLNSHRRFFLSYVAPVVWSLAQIAACVVAGRYAHGYPLAEWVAWAAVAGSLLQILVQLPTVLSLLSRFRPRIETASKNVREVTRNFGPVVVSRGVVQISAYIDSMLASWLPTGAVAAIAYAQILYTLPISLFGMAVSAAELPEMSSVLGGEAEVGAELRSRIARASGRIAYFVVPSCVAFVLFGDVASALVFQTGRFTREDATYVWSILAGASVGLLGVTLGRLYASAYYALRDTRTPLRFAVIRLVLTAGLGAFASLALPGLLGVAKSWGAAGLTASAGIAGWIEFLLLRRSLRARIGAIETERGGVAKPWLAALVAAGAAFSLRGVALGPVLGGCVVLAAFGAVYVLVTRLLGVPTARELLRRARP